MRPLVKGGQGRSPADVRASARVLLRLVLLGAVLLTVLAIAGCGGSGGSAATGPAVIPADWAGTWFGPFDGDGGAFAARTGQVEVRIGSTSYVRVLGSEFWVSMDVATATVDRIRLTDPNSNAEATLLRDGRLSALVDFMLTREYPTTPPTMVWGSGIGHVERGQ